MSGNRPQTDKEHPMTDQNIAAVDTVPEADFAEQSLLANPNDDEFDPDLPVDAIDREADEADVIDQSIPVPQTDDDYAEPAEPEY
jgi:hypothetical protein